MAGRGKRGHFISATRTPAHTCTTTSRTGAELYVASTDSWPAEQTVRLIRSWNAGESADQCAISLSETFGRPRTRRGVLSMLYRLRQYGVELRGGNTQDHRPGSKAFNGPTPERLARAATPTRRGPDLVVPKSERRTFEELTPSCCRWPIGNPGESDFHFCGKEKVPGSTTPYCAFHMARAYQTPEVRRRRLVDHDHVREPGSSLEHA